MRILSLTISLFVIQFGYGQSLEEHLKEAALNNPSLKAKYFSYEAALQKVPQVGTLPDPEVSFGFFASPVETRVGPQRAKITVTQMFPWFGTLGAQKDAATEMAKAKYELFVDARNEIYFQVQQSYYSLYQIDAAALITEENIRIMKTYERLAITRFENNKGGMIDVLRVQLETGELETKLINLKEKRKPILAQFNALLNRDKDTEVVVPKNLVERQLATAGEALEDSVMTNPKLKSLAHKEEASINSSIAAKRNGAPKMGVGLSYTAVDKRTDMVVTDNGKDVWMPMLSIKLPIYRKRYKGQIREQELLTKMYEEEQRNTSNQLNSKLQKGLSDMEDASNRLALYKRQAAIAEQALQILLNAYSTGGKDFEEILRLQRLFLKYELETAKALGDKNAAIALIETLY